MRLCSGCLDAGKNILYQFRRVNLKKDANALFREPCIFILFCFNFLCCQTKKIDAVVVGADRVCANGDTANKIGTYNLSIIAAFHKVPFYVAAPITSLDTTLESGAHIPIEERSSDELISTSKAPKSIACWNPAFDVTPASNITGIVTEKGVILPDEDGKFDVKGFV